VGLGASLAAASRFISFLEKWAAVLAILIMTTAVAMQVVWRFVLSSPLAWTEEAARLAMIWMVFMVVGWAVGNGTHVSAGFLVDRFSPRTQSWFEVVTTLAIAAFSGLLLVTGTRLVVLQSVAANTPIGLPRSVFSLQVPISGLFVLVHSADLLNRALAKRRGLFPPAPAGGPK
jgi:TRAP-type transport system small permease protein